MKKRVLFLDRDGTLIEEPPDKQVDALRKVKLLPGVIPALLQLRDAGFRFVMVSNQDGLGTDSFPLADFETCQNHMLQIFSSQGIEFDEIFVCRHFESDRCGCRKPRTGLLARYLSKNNIDTDVSAVIGDRDSDLALAENIGIRGLRVRTEGSSDESWAGICRTLTSASRTAVVDRETRETRISVRVDLDAHDSVEIESGIGFFDHMLEQIAKHGAFGLKLNCEGDLEVDEHHTVEDCAICIGTAMREALGPKAGIGRYGFVLPMDESEARVSLDLSGRGVFVFDGKFNREVVGNLPTELVPHFFQSFAESVGAALHIQVRGQNAHHMIEACFKAVGRALRPAIARNKVPEIPSTKGMLA